MALCLQASVAAIKTDKEAPRWPQQGRGRSAPRPRDPQRHLGPGPRTRVAAPVTSAPARCARTRSPHRMPSRCCLVPPGRPRADSNLQGPSLAQAGHLAMHQPPPGAVHHRDARAAIQAGQEGPRGYQLERGPLGFAGGMPRARRCPASGEASPAPTRGGPGSPASRPGRTYLAWRLVAPLAFADGWVSLSPGCGRLSTARAARARPASSSACRGIRGVRGEPVPRAGRARLTVSAALRKIGITSREWMLFLLRRARTVQCGDRGQCSYRRKPLIPMWPASSPRRAGPPPQLPSRTRRGRSTLPVCQRICS